MIIYTVVTRWMNRGELQMRGDMFTKRIVIILISNSVLSTHFEVLLPSCIEMKKPGREPGGGRGGGWRTGMGTVGAQMSEKERDIFIHCRFESFSIAYFIASPCLEYTYWLIFHLVRLHRRRWVCSWERFFSIYIYISCLLSCSLQSSMCHKL